MKLRNGLTLGVLLLTATARAAQAQINQRPIHWAAIGARATIRPGDTATVAIRASIAEFFHLYSTTQPPGGPIRTTVTLDSSGPFVLHGRVRAPAPDTIPDGSFGMMSEVYSDSITFGLTLRADAHLAAGPSRALAIVRYQACTARYCLPPRVDTVRVSLLVSSRPAR